MYVKLSPENLNHNSYPPHPINIYICGVTIAPNVCGGHFTNFTTKGL